MEDARSINIDFFETYIHLDDLCKETYGFSVSEYINTMTDTPLFDQALVSNWDKSYRTLRHLRHLRNELAHSQNAFERELCTKSDTSRLKSMCYKIKNGTDPLALLDEQRSQKPMFDVDEDRDYIRVHLKKILIGAAVLAGAVAVSAAAFFADHNKE